MTKRPSKLALSLALTAVIGAGVVIGNGYLVYGALAEDNSQKPTVITADGAAGEDGPAARAVIDANGRVITGTQKKEGIAPVDDGGITGDESSAVYRDLKEARLEAQGQSRIANPVFVEGTPSENDLTEEQAISIAEAAIVEKFALTDETLSRFLIHAAFNVVNPDSPSWSITYYPTDQNDFSEIGNYHVVLESPSGKIVKILSAADGVG